MSTTALVAIIAGSAALVAVLVTWLLRFIRHRRRRADGRIAADLALEAALRGPESAISQSGTGSYPRVGGNGHLALTPTRLIFRIYIGTDVVISLDQISGLREQTSYQHRRIGNRKFLVVITESGQAAFAVKDVSAWTAAIQAAAPHPLTLA